MNNDQKLINKYYSELQQQKQIASDSVRDSDEVIKARKEIERLEHNIKYLTEKYVAV